MDFSGLVGKAYRWATTPPADLRAGGPVPRGIGPTRAQAAFVTEGFTPEAGALDGEASANAIVEAVVGWLQRAFTEAPPLLQQFTDNQWEDVVYTSDMNRICRVLERPTPWYDGITLWQSTVADMTLSGNAYWYIVRNAIGAPIQLWWMPSPLIVPRGPNPLANDIGVNIDHYEYRTTTGPRRVAPENIVHFRSAMDPKDPRRGYNKFQSLLREVATDERASRLTETLLRNMGVPGIIIIPDEDGVEITDAQAQAIGERFMNTFAVSENGENQGKPYVPPGRVKIETFGWSPTELGLRELRGMVEERVTAALGVNAAVLGLGAGLATTKVGATLHEFREEAFEGTILPMYRQIASQLTHQLLPQFGRDERHRMVFDARDVRVLQADEIKRSTRLNAQVQGGWMKVAEARRQGGLAVGPEHEVYLVPNSHTVRRVLEEDADAGGDADAVV